jgi:hypothetical protein
MPKQALTPNMRAATEHAQEVLLTAIQDVDIALEGHGCALEYPQLVQGYMAVAGAAYIALTISDAVEHFIEAQEAFAKRHVYDH